MQSFVGPLQVSATLGYYAFAPGITNFGNDTIDLHAQIGRPFDLGYGITVMPYARITEYLGTTGSSLTLFRPGVQVDVKEVFNVSWLSASVDTSGSLGPFGGPVFRPTVSFTAQLVDDMSVTLGVKAASRTDPAPFVAFKYTF